jgi:hypothetical protein
MKPSFFDPSLARHSRADSFPAGADPKFLADGGELDLHVSNHVWTGERIRSGC